MAMWPELLILDHLNLFWIGYQKMDEGAAPPPHSHMETHYSENDLKLDNTYDYDELYTKAQDRDD